MKWGVVFRGRVEMHGRHAVPPLPETKVKGELYEYFEYGVGII